MRFIKDFQKIAHPLCKLLEKECKFDFDDVCLRAFGELNEKRVLHLSLFHRIGDNRLR